MNKALRTDRPSHGSRHRFPSNEVRLRLSVMAYNLANLWRRVLPKKIEKWPLTSLQQRLPESQARDWG